MVPEIGHFALIVAFCLAVIQTIVPIAGAQLNISRFVALAKPVAHGQFVFVAIAFGALVAIFVNKDYSVLYAAMHSNSQLPLLYRVSAVWGGHEGSLLLWVLFLNVWTVAVTVFSRSLDDQTVARVVGVMGFISIGFISFMLFTSNPFERLIPAAPDGQDLNPLLQDPGLAIHPPMLYLGYVGFSVAFAFALAALISGKLDAAWARWSRPWTTAAWMFLTAGIALGSWWAYYELGWGGWWFWDPVENASFMPWLLGTALMHSLAVTDKRGTFKNWTVLLAIAAFSLSLLGTFLVRSGVLTSVHAFTTDPDRGVFILSFLVVVVGTSLGLFAWRAPRVGFGGNFSLISRETALLCGNVILSITGASVLLGTLFPLIYEFATDGTAKISVGPPFFDPIFAFLMTPVVFLSGVGPLLRWKNASLPEIKIQVVWALVAGLIGALLLPLLVGSAEKWSILTAAGVFLGTWSIAAAVVNLITRIRAIKTQESTMAKLRRLPRHYYGMLLAHMGVGVFIFGVTFVRGYEIEKDVRMEIGDTVTLAGYTFRFDGVRRVPGPNYRADQGVITVLKDEKPFVVLHPEKRVYNVQPNPMTEAAIHSNLWRQLYVSLGEPLGRGAWSVRVYYKPFVNWIWGGTGIMVLGGLLAITDRRYRLTVKTSKRVAADGGDRDPVSGKVPAAAMEVKS